MTFDLANTALAVLVIGLLISLAFLIPENQGCLGSSATSTLQGLKVISGLWFIASLGYLLSSLAEIFDSGMSEILNSDILRSFTTQVTLGKLLTYQLSVALCVFIFSNLIKKNGGALVLLLFAISGVVAPLFQSHSSSQGSHGLAIGSLVIHVIALSFWIGSVIALKVMPKHLQALALARVSTIALWSSLSVVLTGLTNAWTRLRLSQDWFTGYGALIGVKLVLTLTVFVVASRIRKGLAANTLVLFEIGVMAAILGIGSILNRFTPRESGAVEFDRVRELVGISMPGEPTLSRVFFEYEANGLFLGALILATALYVRGVVALVRRGDGWPVGRTISFAIGISLLDYATSGGLGLYSHFSFQYHMIAHMVLSMIAPIAIILSAPITLALRTLPIGRDRSERGIRGLLIAALHSRPIQIITHPIAAIAIFDGSLFALYFTPLFSNLMTGHFGHMIMNFHFIAAGLLFFHVIVGIDPNPRKVHHLARVVILLAAMSIHAFFSVALMSANELIDGGYYQLLDRPWATDLLSDQKMGAAIGWAMGEIPIVAALIATFIQWVRSDEREARRADRRSSVDLAEYNAYLEQLSGRNDSSQDK
ncbi:MAG: cytochrome c oxidase assembly protein [Actinobacteria bacterium]|nr:cytochrome c oxidase assembly protein [Actinomycetota bacterium]